MVTVPPQPRMNTKEKPMTKARAWINVLNLHFTFGLGENEIVEMGVLVGFCSWVNVRSANLLVPTRPYRQPGSRYWYTLM